MQELLENPVNVPEISHDPRVQHEADKRFKDLLRHQMYETLMDALSIGERDISRFTARAKNVKTRRRVHHNTILGRARRELKEHVTSPWFEMTIEILGWEIEPAEAIDRVINTFAKGRDLDTLRSYLAKFRSLKQGGAGEQNPNKGKGRRHDRTSESNEESPQSEA